MKIGPHTIDKMIGAAVRLGSDRLSEADRKRTIDRVQEIRAEILRSLQKPE